MNTKEGLDLVDEFSTVDVEKMRYQLTGKKAPRGESMPLCDGRARYLTRLDAYRVGIHEFMKTPIFLKLRALAVEAWNTASEFILPGPRGENLSRTQQRQYAAWLFRTIAKFLVKDHSVFILLMFLYDIAFKHITDAAARRSLPELISSDIKSGNNSGNIEYTAIGGVSSAFSALLPEIKQAWSLIQASPPQDAIGILLGIRRENVREGILQAEATAAGAFRKETNYTRLLEANKKAAAAQLEEKKRRSEHRMASEPARMAKMAASLQGAGAKITHEGSTLDAQPDAWSDDNSDEDSEDDDTDDEGDGRDQSDQCFDDRSYERSGNESIDEDGVDGDNDGYDQLGPLSDGDWEEGSDSASIDADSCAEIDDDHQLGTSGGTGGPQATEDLRLSRISSTSTNTRDPATGSGGHSRRMSSGGDSTQRSCEGGSANFIGDAHGSSSSSGSGQGEIRALEQDRRGARIDYVKCKYHWIYYLESIMTELEAEEQSALSRNALISQESARRAHDQATREMSTLLDLNFNDFVKYHESTVRQKDEELQELRVASESNHALRNDNDHQGKIAAVEKVIRLLHEDVEDDGSGAEDDFGEMHESTKVTMGYPAELHYGTACTLHKFGMVFGDKTVGILAEVTKNPADGSCLFWALLGLRYASTASVAKLRSSVAHGILQFWSAETKPGYPTRTLGRFISQIDLPAGFNPADINAKSYSSYVNKKSTWCGSPEIMVAVMTGFVDGVYVYTKTNSQGVFSLSWKYGEEDGRIAHILHDGNHFEELRITRREPLAPSELSQLDESRPKRTAAREDRDILESGGAVYDANEGGEGNVSSGKVRVSRAVAH